MYYYKSKLLNMEITYYCRLLRSILMPFCSKYNDHPRNDRLTPPKYGVVYYAMGLIKPCESIMV